MHDSPKISIVLVNWNGLSDTRECLASLSAVTYPAASVLVVDNGSGGDEAGALRGEFPWAEVVATGSNLGFTGGNNVGIVRALSSGAEYVLCLNNDTAVAPDFLGPLVQALEDDPQAGIATGSVFYHDRPERLSTLGNWVDLSEVGPSGHINDEHPERAGQRRWLTPEVAEVPAVSGCVLLMRRSVAEATGGFDAAFFAYMEDVDLCLRAREGGWRCLAVPASRVWHKIGGTTGGENSPAANHYYTRNSRRLVMRHGTPAQRRAFGRRYRELWDGVLAAHLRAGRADPSVWRDPARRRRVVDCGVNILIGAWGCSGDRRRYRRLEAAARALVTAWVWQAERGARTVYAVYSRLYWKANAQWPRTVRRLPRPLF